MDFSVSTLDAETAFLGQLLTLKPKDTVKFLDIEPDVFSNPERAELFRAISEYIRNNISAERPDLVVITESLKPPASVLTLTEIISFGPFAGIEAAEYYVKILKERHAKHKLLSKLTQISEQINRLSSDRIADELLKLAIEFAPKEKISHKRFWEVADKAISTKQSDGILTGIEPVDAFLEPWLPGQLIIIGAGTGVGKSAFAMQIAWHNAKLGHGVYYCSLEMSSFEVARRIIQQGTGVKMRGGVVEIDDITHVTKFIDENESVELFIDDNSSHSVQSLAREIMSIPNREKIKLLIVDYLQLMLTSGKSDNRVNEVSKISRDLKILSKQLKIPIIALSQLSRRYAEQAEHLEPGDKIPIPHLSHLRESGSIEMDADCVLLLARDVYRVGEAARRHEAYLSIAKQRFGVSDVVVPLLFNENFCAFFPKPSVNRSVGP